MPKDPIMLLSYVNLKLRDNYSSLSDFCKAEGVIEEEVKEQLAAAGFEYVEDLNQFK